jgi:hypothetical protein
MRVVSLSPHEALDALDMASNRSSKVIVTAFGVASRVEPTKNIVRKKKERKIGMAQPEPFTPGLTKSVIREHARQIYRQRLLDRSSLTLEEWVLAEKNLVEEFQEPSS